MLAHPDDETWLSGTLAHLAQQGHVLQVVYASSGGAGKDRSGRQLKGRALARVREQESRQALAALGVQQAPIFLNLPDRKLIQSKTQALQAITQQLKQFSPDTVISFGHDGVTGHKDHILVGQITHTATEQLAKTLGNLRLFQVAVSEQRAQLAQHIAEQHQHPYRIARPVANKHITEQIDVSAQNEKRVKAFQQHLPQFPPSLQALWQVFVSRAAYEEFHHIPF